MCHFKAKFEMKDNGGLYRQGKHLYTIWRYVLSNEITDFDLRISSFMHLPLRFFTVSEERNHNDTNDDR